ncbi:hypothetical protein INT45_008552 [Circinella minor]|uniref:Uncharacterized protein n=1 Tax=Circinella minor TaxID=1195481 RepID=A0A8H7S0C6_9FUNG|nr:hypothetical protein INT45_008552 [Circinella minor]
MVVCGICTDQEKPCQPPAAQAAVPSLSSAVNELQYYSTYLENIERKKLPTDNTDEDDTSRLTLNQLTSLAHSPEVVKYLQDPQIRDWVTRIDRSIEPEKEIDTARTADPKLEEFIQLLLKTTGHEHN